MKKEVFKKLLDDIKEKKFVVITKDLVGESEIAKVAFELARELKKEGYDVKIIAEKEDAIRVEAKQKVFGLVSV